MIYHLIIYLFLQQFDLETTSFKLKNSRITKWNTLKVILSQIYSNSPALRASLLKLESYYSFDIKWDEHNVNAQLKHNCYIRESF